MEIITFSEYRRFKLDAHARIINYAAAYRALGMLDVSAILLRDAAKLRTDLMKDIKEYKHIRNQ